MTLALLFAGLWCLGAVAPDTPVGRVLHRWMVAVPAARLARITNGQLLLTVVLVAGIALGCWVVGEETVRLMGLATPELASWITMFEVTSYLDALVAVVTASAALRVGRWSFLARPLVRRAGRRAARSRRSRPARPAPANDDDGRPAALAA